MSLPGDEIKFSAIVVTCNEERYLRRSLESLSFCDEVIVVDLCSTDSSVAIAKELGAKVLTHPRVPVVEKVREFGARQAKNDWIVFLDPDEVMFRDIAGQIRKAISGNHEAAMLRLPWKFYFKEKPLECCIWGAENSKVAVVNRKRVSLKPHVHKGFELLEGYKTISVQPDGRNFITHYWMHSYGQLFEKHLRYIKQEGEVLYNSGERFSWLALIQKTRYAVTLNLFHYRGIRCGFAGIFLSFFYGWYIFMSLLSLRKYEQGSKCVASNP